MDDFDLISIIRERSSAALRDQISPSDRLTEDLGIDSIGIIELTIKIEEVQGMQFDGSLLTTETLQTVQDLLDIVGLQNCQREETTGQQG